MGDKHPAHATTVKTSRAVAPVGAQRIATLTLAYHPDLGRIGQQAKLYELSEKRSARLSRLTPKFVGRGEERVALNDAHLSRKPIFIEPTSQGIELALQRDRVGSGSSTVGG